MPRNINQLQFGKVSITSDEPLDKLASILDKLIEKHGYPEEKRPDPKLEEDFRKIMEEPDNSGLAQTKPRKI